MMATARNKTRRKGIRPDDNISVMDAVGIGHRFPARCRMRRTRAASAIPRARCLDRDTSRCRNLKTRTEEKLRRDVYSAEHAHVSLARSALFRRGHRRCRNGTLILLGSRDALAIFDPIRRRKYAKQIVDSLGCCPGGPGARPGVAQEPDARTLLQTSLKAMGGENLKSITYSGTTGYVANVGPELFPGERLARESDHQLHPHHRLRRQVLEGWTTP